MTGISDDEEREIAWASSEAGKAAVRAASEALHRIDPDGDWPMGTEYLTAIVYASFLAYVTEVVGEAAEAGGPEAQEPPEDEAGHTHRWKVMSTQEAAPLLVFMSKPVPRTAVLMRCEACGLPDSILLNGHWNQADLAFP